MSCTWSLEYSFNRKSITSLSLGSTALPSSSEDCLAEFKRALTLHLLVRPRVCFASVGGILAVRLIIIIRLLFGVVLGVVLEVVLPFVAHVSLRPSVSEAGLVRWLIFHLQILQAFNKRCISH